MPIGSHIIQESFISRKFDLKKHDRIYMFTDGFADQIGGEFNKKLKRKGFKEQLSTIQNKPIQKHEEFCHLPLFVLVLWLNH